VGYVQSSRISPSWQQMGNNFSSLAHSFHKLAQDSSYALKQQLEREWYNTHILSKPRPSHARELKHIFLRKENRTHEDFAIANWQHRTYEGKKAPKETLIFSKIWGIEPSKTPHQK
jgi:hypothetical protein